MQYREAIKLSATGINAITGNGDGRTDDIAAELGTHIKTISALLTSYHWNEKGMVYGVMIDAASVQIDHNGNGFFTVKYGINIHYGCSDMSIELDNKMVIGIDANILQVMPY